MTIDWNDLTWNDLTVERNDRIPTEHKQSKLMSQAAFETAQTCKLIEIRFIETNAYH